MAHPEYEPGSESADPSALGNIFRVAVPWIQEHGTVSIGQIVNPVDGDDLASSYELDGDVVCALLPEVAARLDIRPGAEFSCGFWPAYVEDEEDVEPGEDSVKPPECDFRIKYRDDPLIDSAAYTIYLEGLGSDNWLGSGRKKVDYWQPHDLTPEEILLNDLVAAGMPRDPITQAECEALQIIADNLHALKHMQENR